MTKKITKTISANLIISIYALIYVGVELLSLIYFDCSPYLSQPVYPMLIWVTILFVLFQMKSERWKAICSYALLLIQCTIILASNYLFLSNGTVFERSMLKQRNDAKATIEQFYLTPGLVVITVIALLGYLTFLIIYFRKHRQSGGETEVKSVNRRVWITVSIVLMVSLKVIPSSTTNANAATDYESMLYKSDSSYQTYGMTGNFIYEMLRGDKDTVKLSDRDDLEKTIYEKRADISTYNGISQGNNLIMILAESLEWYPLTIYSKEQTEALFPNLSRMVDESVLMKNFYSREKTDTAESLMLIGSNPTNLYTHNDFAKNAYPYSLPNLFRQQALAEGDDNVSIRSFHQNTSSFYNRNIAHQSFGFEELVGIEAMEQAGLVNTWNSKQEERTLDSLTIETMKDEMFPKDKRFFSFWLSFSSHGFYHKRDNLEEYYERFDELKVFPQGGQYENYLRTYAATIADFDKAIGIILDDLEKKGILDETTIAVIADHNTYYNKLSNYVKDIDTQFDPELYRVPFIIYDQKLTAEIKKSKTSKDMTKFTTTSDVIPTILDLFGIPAWDNLYFGSTVFNPYKESIIYSRAYNVFLNQRYMGYSINSLKYVAPDATMESKKEFEKSALDYLNQLEWMDKIFYSDYFSNHPYQP